MLFSSFCSQLQNFSKKKLCWVLYQFLYIYNLMFLSISTQKLRTKTYSYICKWLLWLGKLLHQQGDGLPISVKVSRYSWKVITDSECKDLCTFLISSTHYSARHQFKITLTECWLRRIWEVEKHIKTCVFWMYIHVSIMSILCY